MLISSFPWGFLSLLCMFCPRIHRSKAGEEIPNNCTDCNRQAKFALSGHFSLFFFLLIQSGTRDSNFPAKLSAGVVCRQSVAIPLFETSSLRLVLLPREKEKDLWLIWCSEKMQMYLLAGLFLWCLCHLFSSSGYMTRTELELEAGKHLKRMQHAVSVIRLSSAPTFSTRVPYAFPWLLCCHVCYFFLKVEIGNFKLNVGIDSEEL